MKYFFTICAVIVILCQFLLIGCKEVKTQLFDAASTGDLTYIRTYLEAGGAVDVCYDHRGATPLDYALGSQQFEVVKLLLKNGATVIRIDPKTGGKAGDKKIESILSYYSSPKIKEQRHRNLIDFGFLLSELEKYRWVDDIGAQRKWDGNPDSIRKWMEILPYWEAKVLSEEPTNHHLKDKTEIYNAIIHQKDDYFSRDNFYANDLLFYRYENGTTLLMIAAMNGNLNSCLFFIKCPYMSELYDINGDTIFEYIDKGLLNAQEKIELKKSIDQLYLIEDFSRIKREMKDFNEYKKIINRTDSTGKTPIMKAVDMGYDKLHNFFLYE